MQGPGEKTETPIPTVAEGPVNSTHSEAGNNQKEGAGSVSGDVYGEQQQIVATSDQKGEAPRRLLEHGKLQKLKSEATEAEG